MSLLVFCRLASLCTLLAVPPHPLGAAARHRSHESYSLISGGRGADTGDHRFVAPDNGVLTLVLKETPAKKIVELTERRYARPTVSRTFEGRDRFAPAAAWLGKGIQLAALGRPVSDIVRLDMPAPESSGDTIRGVVVRVDRFGNLVTNIDRKLVERLGADIAIQAGDKAI